MDLVDLLVDLVLFLAELVELLGLVQQHADLDSRHPARPPLVLPGPIDAETRVW